MADAAPGLQRAAFDDDNNACAAARTILAAAWSIVECCTVRSNDAGKPDEIYFSGITGD